MFPARFRLWTNLLRSRRPLGMWLHGAAGAVVVILLVESFVTLGLVIPVRVAGSSMSPTFEGTHATLTCPECRWEFDVGVDQLPLGRPLVCPDCQVEFPCPPTAEQEAGRRLVVDRIRHATRLPQRWEVVVVRNPEDRSSLCVKRIVGLPGEQLSFRKGDLWVDGKLFRKSLDQQLALRQLVHRDREALRFWQPDGTGWGWDEVHWQAETPTAARLTFAPAGGTPITDDLATNQRATRRPHLVSDLMIACQVKLTPGATLQACAQWADISIETRPIEPPHQQESFDLIVSWFDQQLLVAIDGQVVEQREFDNPWPGQPQLQLVASGGAKVSQLEVWRDIHYHTRPGDLLPPGGIPAKHYFVVGDNVAISSDSRTWEGAGVPIEDFVGGIFGY